MDAIVKRLMENHRVDESARVSDLTNNLFWDNTDPEGKTGAVFHKSDLRELFTSELIEYWENSPYKLASRKVNRKLIQYLGLFGTGAGVRIKSGAFPLKKSYSQDQLIKDFASEYNIPIVMRRDCIFSNNYSALGAYYEVGDSYNKDAIERARKELYGGN